MGTFRISQTVEQTGVPATTLRFYDKQQLLPSTRTPAGYRTYSDADVDRVQFITAAKQLGLPLDQIRELLGVWDGGLCREIRDELRPMIATQIVAAEHRIRDLQSFRDRLTDALAQLRKLPAKDGPCDPDCAFLHHRPARDPLRDRWQQAAVALPLDDITDVDVDAVPVACSLSGDQLRDRITRWRQVLSGVPRRRTPTGGISVVLPVDRAAALTDLVVAEQQCCPFFTFNLAFASTTVELTADAPPHAQPLLADLFGLDAEIAGEAGSSC